MLKSSWMLKSALCVLLVASFGMQTALAQGPTGAPTGAQGNCDAGYAQTSNDITGNGNTGYDSAATCDACAGKCEEKIGCFGYECNPAATGIYQKCYVHTAPSVLTTTPAQAGWTVCTRNDGDVTVAPTTSPTIAPSAAPTGSPSESPSAAPSESPSAAPSDSPSHSPSAAPSDSPSDAPSHSPSDAPSHSPSDSPSESPSHSPSHSPSESPSHSPSESPSFAPSASPSFSPTFAPSASPSFAPTDSPSESPTFSPSASPSFAPTDSPSESPTFSPSHSPTYSPSFAPSFSPTHSQAMMRLINSTSFNLKLNKTEQYFANQKKADDVLTSVKDTRLANGIAALQKKRDQEDAQLDITALQKVVKEGQEAKDRINKLIHKIEASAHKKIIELMKSGIKARHQYEAGRAKVHSTGAQQVLNVNGPPQSMNDEIRTEIVNKVLHDSQMRTIRGNANHTNPQY